MTTTNSTGKPLPKELADILLSEGDINQEQYQRLIAVCDETPKTSPIRSLVSDDAWGKMSDETKATLENAYVNGNVEPIILAIGSQSIPAVDGMALYKATEANRGQRCELLPSFYVDKSGKVGTSVKFVGPSSAGVPFSEVFKHSSEPHVTMSAHQVALVLVYAKQIGIDSALATCRQSLELAAAEKARLKALKAASAPK